MLDGICCCLVSQMFGSGLPGSAHTVPGRRPKACCRMLTANKLASAAQISCSTMLPSISHRVLGSTWITLHIEIHASENLHAFSMRQTVAKCRVRAQHLQGR